MNNILVSADGKLLWRNKEYCCSLGKNGITTDKKEGDGATPAGCFPIRKIFYRPDKLEKPSTELPLEPLTQTDWWCDDPDNKDYNQHITLPHSGNHERLWREDDLYDIIVVLGYNDAPPIPGRGSAIFMHVARPNYTPTAGCVALDLPDLLEILATIDKETKICMRI